MHVVVRNGQDIARGTPFPAPLCESCNEPMSFNGEYAPTVNGKMVLRREYQCRLCGSGMLVRRTPRIT